MILKNPDSEVSQSFSVPGNGIDNLGMKHFENVLCGSGGIALGGDLHQKRNIHISTAYNHDGTVSYP